jgi:hypothetical protein
VSLDHKQHAGGDAHGSSADHAHGASHDDHAHDAEVEETLAADEQPTPLWLPVVGALLFFAAFILIAAL